MSYKVKTPRFECFTTDFKNANRIFQLALANLVSNSDNEEVINECVNIMIELSNIPNGMCPPDFTKKIAGELYEIYFVSKEL